MPPGAHPSGEAVTLLTPAGPETRHRTSTPIAKPPQRPACSNRDTHQSNTATVGRSHTAAVHLLEAGVEVNVIRGWLGHADLTTTNRYAEINTNTKLAALRATELASSSAGPPAPAIWRTDTKLLDWLASL